MCTYPVQPICTFSCTSVFFINIYYSQYTVLHILSHCTSYSFYFIICSLFHSHLYLYIYIYSLVLCFIVLLLMFFYILLFFLFIFLHFPLSGPVLSYISLLIIPCMIVYVTNNNKEPKERKNLVLGLSLGNTDFQLPPKIFYGVEIWRLARPLQDLEMLLTKPLLRCPGGVFGIIVMLKDPATFHLQCPC